MGLSYEDAPRVGLSGKKSHKPHITSAHFWTFSEPTHPPTQSFC